jgi:AcrR family transcriptional regulator
MPKENESSMTRLDRRAVARLPTKRPSQARFQRILDEAEKLLIEHGLNGFSIPLLAERLGYTRASIYFFFPSPYAVLNELSRRYFKDSCAQIIEFARGRDEMSWRELMARVIGFGVDYYNERPVARMLLLGGPSTDQYFLIQEETNQQLGDVIRTLFQTRGIDLPTEPDAAWLVVDIIDGVLRHSQYRHGRITDGCRDEALRAANSYLATYAEAP